MIRNKKIGIVLASLFVASQLPLTAAQARNTPTAPIVSADSSTSFTTSDALNPWDGSTFPQPTFDFTGDDIVVNVVQNVGSAIVSAVNISLPSGFAATAGTGAIAAVDDGDSSTVCNTANAVFTVSPSGVTAKGFSCSDLVDGTVEFTYTVSGLAGTITATMAGDYPIESQFRTDGNRKVKATAWIVDPTDLDSITLVGP